MPYRGGQIAMAAMPYHAIQRRVDCHGCHAIPRIAVVTAAARGLGVLLSHNEIKVPSYMQVLHKKPLYRGWDGMIQGGL